MVEASDDFKLKKHKMQKKKNIKGAQQKACSERVTLAKSFFDLLCAVNSLLEL